MRSIVQRCGQDEMLKGKLFCACPLAGRAFLRHLFPFSYLELGKDFKLNDALQYGMLPKLYELNSTNEKQDFLRAYTHIYLKEEVWAEHLIRKLEPFQYFLQIAAECNGDVINVANIARDAKVDPKTVSEYYSILEPRISS